ncbi:amidohydrolase family protein [Sanguibacter sp. 25GB23B1]|uniref:amidohydrolase family protein n=1 Tax=unclassified Sanguibacter TaxID=2645534 RepID=UPI0032AEC4EF
MSHPSTATPRPASPTRLTVVNALLLPLADPRPPGSTAAPDWFVGWMTVGEDGLITGIGPGSPPSSRPASPGSGSAPTAPGEVLDARGAMVAPGFVSAHSHIFTSGLRGVAHSQTLYPWVRANGEALLDASAEDMYWYTLHGSLDFVTNGITSAYNFTHSRVSWLYEPDTGYNRPARIHGTDHVTRQFDGTADSGIRVVNSFRLDDEAFTETETIDTFAAMVEASADRTPAGQYLGSSIMGAVQWSSHRRSAELEAQMMRDLGVSNQAHFVETAEGIEFQQSKFGWYEDAGALGRTFLFGHFVHPTDTMIERAVAAGCAMVWQPTSNGRLGSGIADVTRLRDAGMRIGMGLDDQSCTDISDPFQNMRIGMYTMRAKHSDAGIMTPREVLRMHTLGSAEVLGVEHRVGSLEVGKHADFLLVDPRSPDTGPVWDVYATYVMACGLRNLQQVYIGGELASTRGVAESSLAADASAELHARIVHRARAAGLALDHVPEADPEEAAAIGRAPGAGESLVSRTG